MLYIFSGLPGCGKTTLAQYLAKHLETQKSAVYIRIDTIEQTLRDQGVTDLYDQGYKLASAIAAENLSLGLSVVVDSTNPVQASRELWHQCASRCQKSFVDIEITCSNVVEHRSRIENRKSDIPNLALPNWHSVTTREYHPWQDERVQIDTAGKND